MKVHLELTVAEVELILKTLGKLPYEIVGELIPRIQQDVQSQVDQQQTTPEWHSSTT